MRLHVLGLQIRTSVEVKFTGKVSFLIDGQQPR